MTEREAKRLAVVKPRSIFAIALTQIIELEKDLGAKVQYESDGPLSGIRVGDGLFVAGADLADDEIRVYSQVDS